MSVLAKRSVMAKAIALAVLSVLFLQGAYGTKFTFTNRCSRTIWPATLSGSTSQPLPTTGFELRSGQSITLTAPSKWSGRVWARTGCTTAAAGFTCATGDCGSGKLACNGAGGRPPASLAEFTLDGASGNDFYDISHVDGYNVPMAIQAVGGRGVCTSPACRSDVNLACPAELQVRYDGAVVACKSACLAFGQDEYCCRGSYGSPQTCRPTKYSKIFKDRCPQAYSYAYDDASSTFTCAGADYTIVFCP